MNKYASFSACKHARARPTSEHAERYGLCVFSQQIRLGDSSQREITGHVPAQLPVPALQESNRHRDGQHHDRGTTVVLRGQKEESANSHTSKQKEGDKSTYI